VVLHSSIHVLVIFSVDLEDLGYPKLPHFGLVTIGLLVLLQCIRVGLDVCKLALYIFFAID
jgi:hypothetical protein